MPVQIKNEVLEVLLREGRCPEKEGDGRHPEGALWSRQTYQADLRIILKKCI